MPTCSVCCCKKRSGTSSLQKDGVTFHIFPNNPQLRDIWKEFCNKNCNWHVKRTSVICSTHFQISDFQNPDNCSGRRRLVKDAIPSLIPNCNCTVQSNHLLRNGPPCQCSHRFNTVGASTSATPHSTSLGESMHQHQQLQEQGVPGVVGVGVEPSRKRSSPSWCSASDDSSGALNLPELRDPLSLEQCRFCGEFNKDCVKVTSEKPYLVNNRTAFALNGVSVDLDFSDDTLPKTVCRYCDEKLQDIYDFVKQVKTAQDTLIKVAEENEGNETLVIKTEASSPTPEDDTKEGIVESVTVSEREFVKHSVFTHKRKNDNQISESEKDIQIVIKKPKPLVVKKVIAEQKKLKEECETTELIIDIKEEVIKRDVNSETDKDVNNETETKKNIEVSDKGSEEPSELKVATHALLNNYPGDQTS